MIQIDHLTKKFGDFLAVDNISCEIRKGETFALLGPNGSGKSTTLKCLVGLTVPTKGKISFDGLGLHRNPREASQHISYLPQRISFPDSLSAREVLTFYARLRKLSSNRVDELLSGRRFDFNGFAHKPVCEFSGGMMQRLGLAVACLPDAPILVLDEPTVGLDPDGAIHFRDYLLSLKQEGKTIIFSSHMLTDVEQLADRVAILVGGKLVTLESIDALREGLMRDCKMRIVLTNPEEAWTQAARQAGANEAVCQGNSLLVTSHAEDRFHILRAIERAGGKIARFATQELSLEDIYMKCIRHGAANDPSEHHR